MASYPTISRDAFLYQVHHVFLPPKLPQQDDLNPSHEKLLLTTVLSAMEEFKEYLDAPSQFQRGIDMVQTMVSCLTNHGTYDAQYVSAALLDLPKGGTVAFQLRSQNAGLNITRCGGVVQFEPFELLAQNSQVTSCKGRLNRKFPASCHELLDSQFADPGFQTSLTDMLVKLDERTHPSCRPQAKKMGKTHSEERDTIHPKLVTGMLMGLIRGLGQGVGCRQILKHSREEVLWDQTKISWHRSASWLFLRVSLQLILDRQEQDGKRSLFKEFMAFLTSFILKQGLSLSLPNHLVYSMVAKVNNRCRKLSFTTSSTPSWMSFASEATMLAKNKLDKTWKGIQDQQRLNVDLHGLANVDFETDSCLTLPSLKPYIERITDPKRGAKSAISRSATPGFDFQVTEPGCLPDSSFSSDETLVYIELAEFEDWTAKNLQTWLDANVHKGTTCGRLASVMDRYYNDATHAYRKNPINLSIMWLIIMEYWVGCDKSTTQQYPLLGNYDVGFPEHILEPLLLTTESQMARLRQVELYLQRRRQRVMAGYPSAFEGFGQANSFAVQFYSDSHEHQQLHSEILESAESTRQSKLRELEHKRRTYAELMSQYNLARHEKVEVRRRRRIHLECAGSCTKCWLSKRAGDMRIAIHEWPLPSQQFQSQAVVFELRVPSVISEWRDITMGLLIDRLADGDAQCRREHKLWYASKYPGLARYTPSASLGRLVLGSTAKSFTDAHYRDMAVSEASVSAICKNHGCRYEYYDSQYLSRPSDLIGRSIIPSNCSYADLSNFPLPIPQWIRGYKHAHNEVLAKQCHCPEKMTLEEFKAFGNLRSGERLQWHTILTQLMSPALEFNGTETALLLLQAAYEAGPNSDCPTSVYRDAHAPLSREDIGLQLVHGLHTAVSRVEENWECVTALSTFVSLCTRALSLSPSEQVSNACLEFLARVRSTTRRSTSRLIDKVSGSSSSPERTDLRYRVLGMALVSNSTFDVEATILDGILDAAEGNLTCFVETSIIIHDHIPPKASTVPPTLRLAIQKWYRLSHRVHSSIVRRVCESTACLDNAIKTFWAAYAPTGTWLSLGGQKRHVLTSETSSSHGRESLSISLNTLDGSLLVNDLPLSRLPSDFQSHQTYVRLFGDQILEIVPSNRQGMTFSATRKQKGWDVHFTMIDGDLVIRAFREDDSTWEFIPPSTIHDDLPKHFINPYSHWFNVRTGLVEFRSFEDPWTSSQNIWRMTVGDGKVRLKKGTRALIDPRSQSAQRLSAIFGTLEAADYMFMVLDTECRSLELQLKRYDLSFTLDARSCKLVSKHHRGMYVDDDQSVRSLIGLQSQLVLRPDGSTGNSMRAVIIPHGSISTICGPNNHPMASIIDSDPGNAGAAGYPVNIPRRRHHFYRIDTEIGRILDTGSPTSKLLLCHLHAVTSHCLPDPLTRRTGTEEALRILRSTAVSSIERLSDEDAKMLVAIGSISPMRTFYPKKKQKEMQQVKWSPVLDPLAQDDQFCQTVQSILQHGNKYDMFFPEDSKPNSIPNDREVDLTDRALVRNSKFRVYGFGAENHTTSHDQTYRSRDVIVEGSDVDTLERRVCQVATYLASDRMELIEAVSPSLLSDLYMVIGEKADGICEGSSPDFLCKFDFRWLDDLSTSIGQNWCTIQDQLCRAVFSSRNVKYDLMAFFGALLFAQDTKWSVIQTLLAFTSVPDLRSLRQPRHTSFQVASGCQPDTDVLQRCVDENCSGYKMSPESKLPQLYDESDYDLQNRRQDAWESRVSICKNEFIRELVSQWPTLKPEVPRNSKYPMYLAVEKAMPAINQHFECWEKNRQLDLHLREIIAVLQRQPVVPMYASGCADSGTALQFTATNRRGFFSQEDLFRRTAPELLCEVPRTFGATQGGKEAPPIPNTTETYRLRLLLDSLRQKASRPQQHDYVDELHHSFESGLSNIKVDNFQGLSGDKIKLRAIFEEYVESCRDQVSTFEELLFEHLLGLDGQCRLAASSNYFPRLSPIFLLQQLNRHNWPNLPTQWRRSIIQYALAFTHLQRSKRLLAAVYNINELIKELKNVGHTWDLMRFPESLLLEVESNLIIRDVQEKIAAPMRDSSENRVMQLNMGEGKSSVIVPLVAVHLADGTKLVCVVVAKPQSKQMRHMLITKHGGLLDRQIYSLPFSRSIIMDTRKVQQIRSLLDSCIKNGGILLVQPEQLLSFKLMGIEYVRAGSGVRYDTGIELLQAQKFLDSHSRHIIDESDENFSVKFELIYTMGAQKPVELSPDRWVIIQDVLGLVWKYASQIKKLEPDGIELGPGKEGQFAMVRILTEPAGQQLLTLVAKHVCSHGVFRMPLAHQSPENRQSMLKYITEVQLSTDDVSLIQDGNTAIFGESTQKVLLLLRGLFAVGVIPFTLGQKRWRVNYGLTKRSPPTLLAVPYRAKDSPALRSEFSHPDVVIVVTCLSYYYGGLSDDELFTAFELLQRSDQANEVFSEWVRCCPDLPSGFHQLLGINLKDRRQCAELIFPALKFTKAVIDFYLDKVVFPKEMLEFPKKLSASGWDLAKRMVHPSTGFSGTCDSKFVLPSDMVHLDLPDQMHTNASVLGCLLRPENLVKEFGPNMTSESLLEGIVNNDRSIEVILDVGALIVDLDNKQVACKWLGLVEASHKQAAIFLNSEDEIMVVRRDGCPEPFLTSPFVENTDNCLVFLDEAHTRGIDLKLPDHYRAAVTLGPRLTKDRLVQACMRMRKLGKGQSITFLVPQEIHNQIRNYAVPWKETDLTITDILCWSIYETWAETEKSVPLWAMQGLRHQRQQAIWSKNIDSQEKLVLSKGELDDYFEDEAMSLEQRYLPERQTSSQVLEKEMNNPRLAERKEQIERIQQKCDHFGVLGFSSATLQEEQERELAPEIEQERQVERPNPVTAKLHKLHSDVTRLVETGLLNRASTAFRPAFKSFTTTSANKLLDPTQFGHDLLTTDDFFRTVELQGSQSDAFQRSVQWILSTREGALVVLSPWEANRLLPDIERSNHVAIHSYAPRPNMSFPSLQDLKLCATPPLPPNWEAPPALILQLNLFAGQLYFETMDEYQKVCAFLGLSYTPNDGTTNVAVDGFVGKELYPDCRFSESPTAFLHTVMANIRRDCQDISRTHVGRMVGGEILTEKDFSDGTRGLE